MTAWHRQQGYQEGYSMARGEIASAERMTYVDRVQARSKISGLNAEIERLRGLVLDAAQKLQSLETENNEIRSMLGEWVGFADKMKAQNDKLSGLCLKQQQEIDRLTLAPKGPSIAA